MPIIIYMCKIFSLLCCLFLVSHCSQTPVKDKVGTDKSCTINGHAFVDLGLPSGLLWAETNVGASSAADGGKYYAWGETQPSDDYWWNSYKWTKDGGNSFLKYTANGLTVLESKDDVAHMSWGTPCRMPSKKEFDELLSSDNCTCTWTKQTLLGDSIVYGYRVTSKKNGNSIFFPASGYFRGDNLVFLDSYGFYWSSTLDASDPSCAYRFYFCSKDSDEVSVYRYFGLPVRPVSELR